MNAKLVGLLAVLLMAFLIAGCAGETTTPPEVTPPGDSPAAGTSPAAPADSTPGVTDLDDGRIQAEGWLAWIELEGGFYAIVDAPPSDTEGVKSTSGVVMVIGNGNEFTSELESLAGGYVVATGERFEGASIRMAGPEMTLEEIERR